MISLRGRVYYCGNLSDACQTLRPDSSDAATVLHGCAQRLGYPRYALDDTLCDITLGKQRAAALGALLAEPQLDRIDNVSLSGPARQSR